MTELPVFFLWSNHLTKKWLSIATSNQQPSTSQCSCMDLLYCTVVQFVYFIVASSPEGNEISLLALLCLQDTSEIKLRTIKDFCLSLLLLRSFCSRVSQDLTNVSNCAQICPDIKSQTSHYELKFFQKHFTETSETKLTLYRKIIENCIKSCEQ